MTLDADQLRRLCRRRDAGVVAAAAPSDRVAARLLEGVSQQERQALIDDGQAARQEMIEGSLGLVGFVVARVAPTAGLQREDYFQEGVLGLTAAADRFDPARSDYFSSFALPHIRGAVSSLVNTRGGDLSPWQGRTAVRVEREIARREGLGLPSRPEEIAESLKMTQRAVVTNLSYRRPATLTTAGGSPEFPGQPVGASEEQEDRLSPARRLFMLPPQERRVLEAVHGDAGRGRSMADIATELGLNTRQLRAVLDSGHRHLRQLMAKADPDAHRPNLGDRSRRETREISVSTSARTVRGRER